MEITKEFFNLLLDFGDEWEITNIEADHKKEEIYLEIEYTSDYYEDPLDYSQAKLYDHTSVREFRHLDIMHYKSFVRCKIPRVTCFDGTVKQIRMGWSAQYARHTYRFEERVIDLLKATKNQSTTAEFLNCSFRLVNRILHHCCKRGMERRDISKFTIEHISIDEKAFKKGHKYVTVLSHPTTGVVLDVGEDRDSESVKHLVCSAFTEKQRLNMKTVSMDMWKAFIKVSKSMLPNAEVIHDKFHLIAYLNKSMDQVRRREVKKEADLRNSRFVLLKNERNMTEKQKEKMEFIRASNFEVSKVWNIRENFKSLFDYTHNEQEAKIFLVDWANRSYMKNIKEVNKVILMFLRHVRGVVNALTCDLNNAMAERLNGKIQEVKLIGRGYRTFANFRSAILFFHGGLNLYPLRW